MLQQTTNQENLPPPKKVRSEEILLPSMSPFPLKEYALDFFSEKCFFFWAHNSQPLSELHHMV